MIIGVTKCTVIKNSLEISRRSQYESPHNHDLVMCFRKCLSALCFDSHNTLNKVIKIDCSLQYLPGNKQQGDTVGLLVEKELFIPPLELRKTVRMKLNIGLKFISGHVASCLLDVGISSGLQVHDIHFRQIYPCCVYRLSQKLKEQTTSSKRHKYSIYKHLTCYFSVSL